MAGNLADREYGTWSYFSGIDGTVTVDKDAKVVGILAYGLEANSARFRVGGGDWITLPDKVALSFNPKGNLSALDQDVLIEFQGTTLYVVELVR